MCRFSVILLLALAAGSAVGCRPAAPRPLLGNAGAGIAGGNAATPWWQRFENQSAQSGNPWWATSNPGGTGQYTTWANSGNPNAAAASDVAQLNSQIQDLNARLSRFDNLNNGMEAEIASLRQQLQVATDHNYQLRQQLADSSVQFQQMQQVKSQLEQQLAQAKTQLQQASASGTGTPANLVGSASIRANNSLMSKLPQLEIGGIHSQMDGDVIRIGIPSDGLFVQGTYQIETSRQGMLKQLAQAIVQHFPDQRIGIEAHWDRSQIQPTTITAHQLTATQALAVFDYMRRLGVPDAQMFTMAMGSGRTKYDEPSSQDRRIEIVIYPETFR